MRKPGGGAQRDEVGGDDGERYQNRPPDGGGLNAVDSGMLCPFPSSKRSSLSAMAPARGQKHRERLIEAPQRWLGIYPPSPQGRSPGRPKSLLQVVMAFFTNPSYSSSQYNNSPRLCVSGYRPVISQVFFPADDAITCCSRTSLATNPVVNSWLLHLVPAGRRQRRRCRQEARCFIIQPVCSSPYAASLTMRTARSRGNSGCREPPSCR